MFCSGFSDVVLLEVRRIQRLQITNNALLNLLDPSLELSLREVAFTGIHRFELGAIDCRDSAGEQSKVSAQRNELDADGLNRWAVVLPEVRDRLEVWSQPTGQPHQFDIAVRFALKSTARLDAVEVAIKIDLQSVAG